MEFLEDFVIDIPKARHLLAEFAAILIAKNILGLAWVVNTAPKCGAGTYNMVTSGSGIPTFTYALCMVSPGGCS